MKQIDKHGLYLSAGALVPHLFMLALHTSARWGELYRDGIRRKKDYRFYDEREWRIIGTPKQLDNKPAVLKEEDYQKDKEKLKQSVNNSLLKFGLNEISYIIVKNKSEIPQIYEALSNAFNFNHVVINLASITVLTSEQIVDDF